MADQDEIKNSIVTLTKIKEKSDDDYEKNVTYISAGTLVLSLTFIEKIVALDKSTAVWALITSWVILVITLLINLISHQLSSLYHERAIEEYCKSDLKIEEKVDKRNKVIRLLNWSTTVTLIVGISFLILYCSLNAKKMSTEKKDLQPANDSSHIEKGRTITAPLTSGSSTNSTANTGPTTNSGQSDTSIQSTTNSTSKPN